MSVYYNITVPVDHTKFSNEEHPLVKILAQNLHVEHDGGGMALGGTMYEHSYITKDKTFAEYFANSVRGAGFKPRLLRHEEV